ncbi:MAG: DUF4169 family protein [Candidatus Andeanibacterium colombiense]|uniref:DUF4169 family protein n=1 Tax=Candidatus Andeanibacterium colombiense TaxID=3121345 RepID=A0AAJ5XA25_9SPHN|nr:MAG: DUF4169 family protein [Sphingomonadaceae bacterium]
MAEIVNLRAARKAKERAGKQAQTDANRAKFGQTKQAKQARQREAERAESLLDGAKRDPGA